MIKGCHREMILLQTKDSPLFESAYFVLRRTRLCAPRGDMLAEANRIIGEGNQYLSRRKKCGKGLAFLLGALLGGGVFALIACIVGL